jgi:hypothetical protein
MVMRFAVLGDSACSRPVAVDPRGRPGPAEIAGKRFRGWPLHAGSFRVVPVRASAVNSAIRMRQRSASIQRRRLDRLKTRAKHEPLREAPSRGRRALAAGSLRSRTAWSCRQAEGPQFFDSRGAGRARRDDRPALDPVHRPGNHGRFTAGGHSVTFVDLGFVGPTRACRTHPAPYPLSAGVTSI